MNKILIKGSFASPGIVAGKAYVLYNDAGLEVPKYISSFDLEEARLGQAIEFEKLEINRLQNKFCNSLTEKVKRTLDHYMRILSDNELTRLTLSKVRDESVNVEWALNQAVKKNFQPEKKDYHLLEVATHVMKGLLKKKATFGDSPIILVAGKLTLIEALAFNPKIIQGVLTDSTESSDVSEFLRTIKIPAVFDLKIATSMTETGDHVLLDGENAEVAITKNEAQAQDLS